MLKKVFSIIMVLIVAVGLLYVLTELGVVTIKFEGKVDDEVFETTLSLNDFASAIEIQYESDYMRNSDDREIESEMMSYINANYEWLGTTKTKFEMDGYDFDEFYVYQCVYLDKPTLYCLIPIVDGRAQPLGFQYNQDNSLTLIWSR